MKRLYFLIPDLRVAHEVVVDLESIGVKNRSIHVIGGDPEELQNIHIRPANLYHTNLEHALKWGLVSGVFCTILIYTLFEYFLPGRLPIQALFAVGLFGMGFGLWSTGMISLVKNPVIEDNESYLRDGHYIMMVDTADERANMLTAKVREHEGAELAMVSH